ncbi:universal stress protein [Streptomyces sp. 7R007]
MERTIVVGVDGSTRSLVAANWAAREALWRGMPLRTVYVSGRCGTDTVEWWHGFPQLPTDLTAVERASGLAELRAEEIRIGGEPASELLRLGASADLLVLGIRGAGGYAGLSVGSVARTVAECSPRPVVLVPSGPECAGTGWRTDKVSVGVDARWPDDAANAFAFDRACHLGVRLRAVYAWGTPRPDVSLPCCAAPRKSRAAGEDAAARLLSDALRPWCEKYAQVEVVEDVPRFGVGETLVRASNRAELLVVGRRGSRLGAAVNSLVAHAGCPVAVVPE